MKVLIIEYATLITEKLHQKPEFEKNMVGLIEMGFSVRIIYSYNPDIKNPIYRTVGEFKDFLLKCPPNLTPYNADSMLLTGEPSKLHAVRHEEDDNDTASSKKHKGRA